jgi:hypothetical protein
MVIVCGGKGWDVEEDGMEMEKLPWGGRPLFK